ncbi:CK1/CK1/CK1-G protein kinase [Coprinopsis cinerea AmutBmut pab1-1]|nr:CK1/CK1/CK1-G protein kinase [Coprinopsis cinerea AmutBmut pab1-1]
MPTLWAAGMQGGWDYLAIDLLGPSLDNLFRQTGKDTMDLGSVCSIAMQLIARLQFMHTRGVLHRDIQLGNCVIGLPPNDKTIYMIDFGFSKQYIDPHTKRHITDSRSKRSFIGNYWFSSVNVHCRGRVPSRRDDLEAAALMLIHLLTPRGLTWTRNGIPKTDEAHDALMDEKRAARPEDLCRGLPVEFEDFLRYTRKLKFEQCPDYETWIENFRQLKVESGYSPSEDLVWPPQPPQMRKPVTIHTPLRIRVPGAVHRDEMEGILNGLTNLNLQAARPVLGDRTNVVPRTLLLSKEKPVATVNVSSGSEENKSALPQRRYAKPKAMILLDLAKKASTATDNASLARLVKEFVKALQMNSSRTLTKEGSQFLDVLYKQLDDPSVFIPPKRPSRGRSTIEQQQQEPARAKFGVIARLRYEVKSAPSNKALGSLVSDFAKVTNKCVGRTITKDGFVFLEGVAERLAALGR